MVIVARFVETKSQEIIKRLVNINNSGNRGKSTIISTGSISEGVPCSMGAEGFFRPLFRGGMCPSSTMI